MNIQTETLSLMKVHLIKKQVIAEFAKKHARFCKYQITKTEMRLYIKWIGTHEQYNALCKLNQQYTIDLYKK